MTREQLIKEAHIVLRAGREMIVNGEDVQINVIVFAKGQNEWHLMEGDNDYNQFARKKLAFSRAMKARVSKGDVEAVMVMSDVWFTKHELMNVSAKDYKASEDPFARMIDEVGMEAAAEAGYCEKSEALMVNAESPTDKYGLVQPYSRDQDGKPVFEELDESGGFAQGRFANFFEGAATTP